MPMMDKLLSDLNNNPPQTPDELEDMLASTGYSLAPSEGEMAMDGDMAMEEEYAEDMGPDDMGMEEMEMGMGEMPPEGAMDMTIIEEQMPMPEDATPRARRMKDTLRAARNALGSREG